VCGAALLAAQAAHAMDYSYRVVGREIVIDASGEIEEDEGARLGNWLRAQRWGKRRAHTIVFDSPGGIMYGGVQMAAIVERFKLNTGVAHRGQCASACVMAWSAGVHKSSATDADVGVHMARQGDRIASDATLFYANFVKDHGAPDSVVAELISTPPEGMHWLTQAELQAWNVTLVDATDALVERPAPDWRSAPIVEPASAVTKVIVGPGASPPISGSCLLPILIVSLLMIGGSLYSMSRK
jgi:hypothetical protein